nr:hypothetical protein [Tanacetum cinerariifolium]
MLEFPVPGRILTLRSSEIIPLECSTLIEEGRKALCELLRRNLDIFACKSEDMTGVPRHLAEHRLNVREGCLPVRQKKRSQTLERNKAIHEEVIKLVDVEIINKDHYHSWLSNPVMDSTRDKHKAESQKMHLRGGGRHVLRIQDFIVERLEDESLVTTTEVEEELLDPWTLFTDGSSCIDGSRAGLILTHPEGTKFTYALRFRFNATNNEAEYVASIAGLKIAEQMVIKNLQENMDSRLVLRSENKKADALSKIASNSFAHLTKQVLVEELNKKSTNKAEVLVVVEEERETWMTLIYEYLTEETLPMEKEKCDLR